MSIVLVIGTRPEGIKLAPVAALLGRDALVIHTGQHHSAGMIGHVTPDVVVPPDPSGRERRGEQLGRLTATLDRVLVDQRPDAVLVQGDTTSALAGALAANTTNRYLVHVEAGLRSFDRDMPEEHNRVLIDHLADLCCAPTPRARANLLAERVPPERIITCGNTVVEAVAANLPRRDQQTQLLDQLGVTGTRYVLATLHRPENVDDPTALATILRALAALPIPVVLPLHPRTQNRIIVTGTARLAAPLRITRPLDYPLLLALARHAAVIITDSGGIQEEATVLKRPVLVVRRSNERPEVEGTFGIRTVPSDAIRAITTEWMSDIDARHDRLAGTPSPYGDGTASEQIARTVLGRVRRSRAA